MNLTWGDKNLNTFVTNVGLITSNGPHGHNIMACEWTHMISYSPALIVLAIRKHKATYENIMQTKEFGVGIAAENQDVVSSVAGNYSGHEVDKIKVLKDLGIILYKAKHINSMMVQDTCMNAECKLIKTVDIGDHPLIIGEIMYVQSTKKKPLLYHETTYWKVGEKIHKPETDDMNEIKTLIKKHSKKQ